jgi:flavin-dependent dehydrogenase
MAQYDFVIAGAGPAGSVFALLAARAGYRVLLAEKSRFDKSRFGEIAPPELRLVLARVGLQYLADEPFCCDAPAALSVWGGDQPKCRQHILSPYGPALRIDRRLFDEELALAAREAGADLKLGGAVRFVPHPRGGYIAELSNGGEARAQISVLATGRGGGGFGLPYVRRYLDDNVLRWWLEALARTKVIQQVLDGCPLPRTLSVTNARGSYAQKGIGNQWVAIGDSRIAPDPLSGLGIIWAIDDAILVVHLFSRMKWQRLSAEMDARTVRDVEAYSLDHARTYATELRFNNSQFWNSVLLSEVLTSQKDISLDLDSESSGKHATRLPISTMLARSAGGTPQHAGCCIA